MRLLAAAGLVGACLATTPLFAADLFDSAPPPMDMPPPQTELGSNWYIRGDVGYGQIDQATVVPSAGLFPTIGNAPIGDANTPVAVTRGNNQSTMTPTFGLGFGYRVNDWFRVDADWQFSKGPGFGTTQSVYCPEVANAVSNYNTQTVNGVSTVVPVPVGYQYDYTKCDGNLHVNQYNNTALVMGYVDLGHWGLFTPYIGAGAGVNANTMSGSLSFNQQDTGVNYTGATVNGTAPGNWVTQTSMQNGYPYYSTLQGVTPSSGTRQPVGPANWSRTINTTKYTFAGALAAGVGIQISQSATLDLAYKIMTFDITGGVKSTLQSVNLGVRYNLN
jgi:opacity protein-like surface antigen